MKGSLNEAKRLISLFASEEDPHTFQVFDDVSAYLRTSSKSNL